MILKFMILWNFIWKLHIQNPFEKLLWSFFVEMINVLKPLIIFAGEPHCAPQWCRGVVIITTAQLHSTKPELRFCTGSNPARDVSKIRDGEDL